MVQASELDLGANVGRQVPEMHIDHVFSTSPLSERVDAFRRGEIQAAVKKHHGNWAAAARELGLHRSNLHPLAARLGLKQNQE
jgi:transcriptional regulator with GAF, ATPase, and Fis domain